MLVVDEVNLFIGFSEHALLALGVSGTLERVEDNILLQMYCHAL